MSKKVFKVAGIAALGFATFGIGTLVAGGAALGTALGTSVSTFVTGSFVSTGLFSALSLGTLALGGVSLLGAASSLDKLDRGRGVTESPQQIIGRLNVGTDPNKAREVIVGEVNIAGTIRYRNEFDLDGDQVTWMVLVLAGYPCDSLQGLTVNGLDVTYPGGSGGAIVSGNFAGNLWVYFRDGRSVTDAFTEITTDEESALGVGNSPWDDKTRYARGICCVAIKAIASEEFDGRLEPVFQVRGARLYDPRLDTTVGGSGSHRWDDETTFEWSNAGVDQLGTNPAVQRLNLLRGFYWQDSGTAQQLIMGRGLLNDDDRIDFDNWIEAANICDEDVQTLTPASAMIKRYTSNGILNPELTVEELLVQLDTADGGNTVESAGQFKTYPAEYRAPTLTFTEADFVGLPTRVNYNKSPEQRVNVIRGGFADETNGYKLRDYPSIKDSASITRVGVRPRTLNFPFTTDHRIAQRLATIAMNQHNAGKAITANFTHRALKLAPGGEAVAITHGLYGFAAEPMRVGEWNLVPGKDDQDAPIIDVEMSLYEDDSTFYTWDPATDEQAIDSPEQLPATKVRPANIDSYTLLINQDINGNTDAGEGVICSVNGFGNADTNRDGSIRWNGSRITIPRDAGDDFTFVGGGIGQRKAFICFDTAKPGTERFTAGGTGRHVALAYLAGGSWYYDDGAGSTSFTPIRDRDVALGWVEMDDDDIVDGGIFGQPMALELAPQAAATNQATWGQIRGAAPVDLIFDQFNYADQTEFEEFWEGAIGSITDVSFLTGLTDAPGGTAVRFGDNSGDDQNWLWRPELLMPYDGISLYEVGVIVREPAGAGGFYCGLVGVAEDGATLLNNSGLDSHSSQHYLAASNQDVNSTFQTFRGYVRGWSGTPASSNRTDPVNPGQMYTGVVYVAPMFIANYSAAAGQHDIAAMWVRRVPGGLAGLDSESDLDALDLTNGPSEADADVTQNSDYISKIYVKASDETVNNSSTFQDDDDLVDLPLLANQRYEFELFLRFFPSSGMSNAVLKYFFDFSQTPQYNGHAIAVESGSALTNQVRVKDLSQAIENLVGDLNQESVAHLIGTFETNASTGGMLTFRWAQQIAASADLILREGSSLRLTPTQ